MALCSFSGIKRPIVTHVHLLEVIAVGKSHACLVQALVTERRPVWRRGGKATDCGQALTRVRYSVDVLNAESTPFK
jgi:hypothetical protein